jgi:hypothetical protein
MWIWVPEKDNKIEHDKKHQSTQEKVDTEGFQTRFNRLTVHGCKIILLENSL